MSEFIDQFILESRELVDMATRDLLALEQDPTDAQKLDSVFRAFHTLKGGAAIVDFSAMARAMHAVEDVLSAARSRNRPLTPTRVGECLECLDQVVQWLDCSTWCKSAKPCLTALKPSPTLFMRA
jgi:two-component system chemotaxis sensor kinase CheA